MPIGVLSSYASKMPCKDNTIIWIIYYNEA